MKSPLKFWLRRLAAHYTTLGMTLFTVMLLTNWLVVPTTIFAQVTLNAVYGATMVSIGWIFSVVFIEIRTQGDDKAIWLRKFMQIVAGAGSVLVLLAGSHPKIYDGPEERFMMINCLMLIVEFTMYGIVWMGVRDKRSFAQIQAAG